MPAADPRYCIAEVSEEAIAGWRSFTDRHAINRTALGEVIGLYLASVHEPTGLLREWIDAAVALQNERRARGG